MQSQTVTTAPQFVHVVGPDVQRNDLRSLVQGDFVLAELNGRRLFSDIPIASAQAWEVVDNTDDTLVIAHPEGETFSLPYSSLLPTSNNSPAVFHLKRNNPECPQIYVILQLISHKSTVSDLRKYRWFFNEREYRDNIFNDPIMRRGLLEQWCEFFKTFSEKGWGHKSILRFALRAGVSTKIIRAFRSESWDQIYNVSMDTLLDMAREINLLPSLLELSGDIQFDTERVIKPRSDDEAPTDA